LSGLFAENDQQYPQDIPRRSTSQNKKKHPNQLTHDQLQESLDGEKTTPKHGVYFMFYHVLGQ